MKIISLVENITKSELKSKHGLSLYIETKNHNILFDLGPDNTLIENAKKRNIDLLNIDTVIISHGHIDHGGALEEFLKINSKAKVYVQRKAFEPHYSKTFFIKIPVGLNENFKSHSQIILLDGDYIIDEELRLFTVDERNKCYSNVNNVLYDKNGRDNFLHEQNLLVTENEPVLIIGCGHSGIVNIMEKACIYNPKICIGGFHLFNPITKKTVSPKLLDTISEKLQSYNQTHFYTCHCTGTKAFQYLSMKTSNLSYLFCGDSIEI